MYDRIFTAISPLVKLLATSEEDTTQSIKVRLLDYMYMCTKFNQEILIH